MRLTVRNEVKAGHSWGRAEKLAVRRLYLQSGLSPSEIAAKLDRAPHAVSCLVSRHGWTKVRREAESRAAKKAEEQAVTAAEEFVQSVAAQSEELTEAGFDLAREAAAGRDAKGFVMAASGTKIFAALARQAMGIDAANAQAGTAQPLTVVFYRPPDAPAPPEPVNVTPAAEVDAPAEDLDFA